MSPPLVSVVVSSYDRPRRLGRLLDALSSQSLAGDSFEVIVVDNGSAAETGAVLDREQRRNRLELRTIRHERTLGPAAGRNSGWQLTRAPLVAFTDDDCRPASTWLECLLQAARDHPGAIVQGRTEPDPLELQQTPRLILARTVRIERLGPQFETCNILYPRSALEELGGFDERFGLRPAGEDTDLAWRAIEGGRATVFAPAAVVHHAVESLGLLGMLRDGTRWGACARLFAEHPRRRSILYRGVFWNVWHYLLVRSLAALLAPPWLRRRLLAGHLAALRRRARSAGSGPGAVPVLLAYDTAELLAMVGGAVRHRTLVL
ncbi:MAG: glycosyltransferase family 2 protein [Solirubrobacteraceae bacterium]